ncbi:MAG: transporter substrate-binding domain-containing protein [Parvibaculaceae bacterium]
MRNRDSHRLGLLFSSTGPYATIGQAMLNGALLAIEEINANDEFPFSLEPVAADPGGVNSAYMNLAKSMLAEEHLTHVVGCYTSSSRKEVLPYFEKYDGLLWYPSHYEGFESSENIVYTGASPNQHIVPLTDFLLKNYGNVAYLLGSNYIWAWENNKIMREALLGAGGTVLAERYVPVHEMDHDTIVAQILDCRPDFIFNTLIGESAYAFFRTLRQEAMRLGIDQVREMPVASCSLSEPELAEIGTAACDGHISSSVYFESIESEANYSFTRAYRERFPQWLTTSADAESSYIAVHLLARALRRAGSDDMLAVRQALPHVSFKAPQGRVHIDGENRHSFLTPRIAVSNSNAGFDIIYESTQPIRPDPYLVWADNRIDRLARPIRGGNPLRLVK